ncbi:type II toxin-antitoxin system CcdA family antitoxin [Eoetvoesiella caeni]
MPQDQEQSERQAAHRSDSKAAEAGVALANKRKRTELWLKENKEAIDSSNAFVEEHGLPLAKYRMF